MKKMFPIALSLLAAMVVMTGCIAAPAPKSKPLLTAPEFAKPIKYEASTPLPGVEQQYYLVENAFGHPQSITVVAVDLNTKTKGGKSWKAGLEYCGKERETVPAMAKRIDADIAINASFFVFTKAPEAPRAGLLLIVNGEKHGEPRLGRNYTGMLSINDAGLPRIAPFELETAQKYRNVVQTYPLLMDKGELTENYPDDKRHPRSLVGLTADNKLLLIAVDGRHAGKAGGLTYRESALLCKQLGCVTALNLDGGGSTTLTVKGDVLNYPCDNKRFDHEGLRKVNDIFYLKLQ